MAIDHSIYKNRPSLDISGYFDGLKDYQNREENKMRLDEFVGQKKKKNAIDDAYKSSVVQNPDGTTSLDQNKLLKQIYNIDGQMGSQLQGQFDQQKAAKQKAQYESMKEQLGMTGQLLGGVKDQQSYDMAKAQAQKFGLDISQLPQQYDANYINQLNQQVLTSQQRLDNEMKSNQFGLETDKFNNLKMNQDRDYGLKREELMFKKKMDYEKAQRDWEALRAKNKGDGGASVGQKKVDTKFAEDYNDWTSGGADRTLSEIKKIDNVVTRLKEGKGTTGGLTGIFGDRFTSSDVLANRAAAQQSAMTLVKTLLSGATSDKDREQIVNTLWNEADSTENNIARLKEFSNNMKSKYEETNQKAKYFESTNGTLKGFSPITNKKTSINQTQNKTEFKTNELDWAD